MSPHSKRYPCALYYPGSHAVVGGNGLGFHKQPHTSLVLHDEGDVSFDLEERCLGDNEFKTLFPSGQEEDVVVLQINVNSLHNPTVDGVGFPFDGKIEELVKLASNLENPKLLAQIACQDRFNVLVKSHVAKSVGVLLDRNPSRPQPVISEDPYQWDLDHYQGQVPQGMGKTKDAVRWGFDSPEQVRNILTRSVAQDVWWFAEDVRAIRKCVLPFRFLKEENRSDAFTVTVDLGKSFRTKFERSLQSLIRPGANDLNWAARICKTETGRRIHLNQTLRLDVFRPSDPQAPAFRERDFDLTISSSDYDPNGIQPAYLCFYDGIALSRRRIEAANEVFSTDDGEDSKSREETATDSQSTHRLERFKNTIAEDGRSAVLPKFDLVGRVDSNYLEAALSELNPGLQRSFEQYAKLASLGIFTICGSGAWSRNKTDANYHTNQVLAFTTLMFLQNQETRKVHAAASTHQAAREIAAHVYCMAAKVLEITERPGEEVTLLLVVRGYNIDAEVAMFINQVSKKIVVEEMAPWGRSYSLCEWLQKVVQAGDHDLDARDHPGLFELRQQFKTAKKYTGLRAFVNGKIRFSQIKSGRNGRSGEQQEYYESEEDADVSHEGTQRRTAKLKAQVLPKKLLKGLMKAIAREADVICTTTHISRDETYESFRKSAGAVVLCDAGTMSRTEAMVVWGNKLRPCAIGGNICSTTRTFIDTEVTDKEGKYLNRFAPDAQVSILSWAQNTGHPCFDARVSSSESYYD
ncbi:hypothetical protein CkaCkLH20_04731 [Colletotrichum karsti]|uniref:Uncharacterized protein n=1 Tax=Colletotrichum karsti TaxID=1095194 RepID=A0A9P6IBR1_9PEZI|nr:uncharacterized protein CkaCkLH20_04731 [Colletotrichum karsti]KAF9877596.1 hypothetical protein CkaCkLH20_04731 [Colletotrichum karsti]